MSPWLAILLVLAGSYLLGSFPTSYLVARRLRGIDLRQHGSGNLGATNVFRTLGWRPALPVVVVDIAKGALPVVVASALPPAVDALPDLLPLLAAIGAVLGHSSSPWVGFSGGKGVATAAGAFFTLAPAAAIPAVGVWFVLLLSTRIMSIASVAAAATLPVSLVQHELSTPADGTRWASLGASVLVAVFVVWKHRANLDRLRQGTEKGLW